jgi:3-isopropylmalate/(R)-2-methylmalate dehydratase small subunit
MQKARVLITRSNFGCGSSREHAVWALEVNDINVVIGESFARIFRQNMFNCGILAVELSKADLDRLFAIKGEVNVDVDLAGEQLTATSTAGETVTCGFTLNPFDKKLIGAGGWLAFADANY